MKKIQEFLDSKGIKYHIGKDYYSLWRTDLLSRNTLHLEGSCIMDVWIELKDNGIYHIGNGCDDEEEYSWTIGEFSTEDEVIAFLEQPYINSYKKKEES